MSVAPGCLRVQIQTVRKTVFIGEFSKLRKKASEGSLDSNTITETWEWTEANNEEPLTVKMTIDLKNNSIHLNLSSGNPFEVRFSYDNNATFKG